jgi:ankyrin repeat protein
MGFVVLSLIFFLTLGCGQHQSQRKTFNLGGSEQTTQVVVDPILQLQMAIADNQTDNFFNLMRKNQFSQDLVLPNGREILIEAIFYKRSKIIRGLKSLGAKEKNFLLEGLPLRDWIDSQTDKNKILRALDKSETDDKDDLSQGLLTLNYQVIKSLIDEDIDPNFILENGETPLTWSIQKKSLTAIRALLAGSLINVNFLNQNGESALWWARQLQMRSVVTELQRRGAIEKRGEL